MKAAVVGSIAIALALALAAPARAAKETGQVDEIIVKIHTKDGVKYFAVGKDAKLVDLKPGKLVEFDYSDSDVIDSIGEAPDQGKAKQSLKKDQPSGAAQ